MGASLRDRAYAALKQAIMDADIYAHRDELRLDERQLSEALGVSRTPIREAMTLLEQDGFLRTEPRRGIFIVRKTKKQIVEMIEMWAAIESMAARLATINASDAGIGALRPRRPSISMNIRTRTLRSTRRSSRCPART
jgi:DNA-binding GntR family transcriptional regulator